MTSGDYSEARLGRTGDFHIGSVTSDHLNSYATTKYTAYMHEALGGAAKKAGRQGDAARHHRGMVDAARAGSKMKHKYKPESRSGAFYTSHKATLGAELRN